MEALDEGAPANEADYRDAVYELEAPFNGRPRLILKTIQRFAGIVWGNDQIAISSDQWWNTRNSKSCLFNPSDSAIKPEILFDQNYQDNYANPGSFVTEKNEWGENTLVIDRNNLYLTGTGHSPDRPRPFFRTFSLKTRNTTELWRADGKETFENIVKVFDPKKGILLTRVESANVFPNYFIRNTIKRVAPQQITFFENPYQSLQQVHKELITYRRSDGIELSGTLYIPAGYDFQKKEKLPMVMWAYPQEFKDASSAGQVTSSPHTFIAPNYGSPIFLGNPWVCHSRQNRFPDC